MARVSKAVQEIRQMMEPDRLGSFIANKFTEWEGTQRKWIEQSKELRDYLFATDTNTTSNKKLPWKNSTTQPKLTQLRDNLHANYMAALFPHDNWFRWVGDNKDADMKANAALIEAYVRQKVRESNFKSIISRLVYDYIDYGNSFGEVTYETNIVQLPDGSAVDQYTGPVLHRISPLDIYFDLTADNFYNSPKITRRLVSMGSLKRAAEIDPEGFSWVNSAVDESMELRSNLSNYSRGDIDKSQGYEMDGFGPVSMYYSSDMIELLEWEGDLFDHETGQLHINRKIIVMDRRKVVYNEPLESWLGRSNKEHVGWRDRPDNLMGMGPLDNLVGMQYRIDHLENLKADVFDQIAHPMYKVRGLVEEFEHGPGERIFMDIDADVETLRPDATALNADFQIDRLMRDMEELAGAPRQAMGVRTPGEKTAFEVQALENAAGRIFQQKIQKFEEQFIEPLLNQMLEAARRNMTIAEQVRTLDEDFGVARFRTITPEILGQRGKLYPQGARHFAQQAQLIQNLNGFVQSAAYADPLVQAHISALKIAELYEENLGLSKFDLVQNNIRIAEQQQTQSLNAQAQENVAGEIAGRQAADEEEPL